MTLSQITNRTAGAQRAFRAAVIMGECVVVILALSAMIS